MTDESATAARRIRSHCQGGRRRRRLKLKGAVPDLISTLPDVILQHILTFIPTKHAITTSLLSKRWKHVWCDTPSLSFDSSTLNAAWINNTPTRYTAPKIIHFHLYSNEDHDVPYIDRWIEFVMSRQVESLSLSLRIYEYNFHDFFYISSTVKQLTLKDCDMFPKCLVSWTSLKNLSLISCSVSDESLAKIISGCPSLESLTLYRCEEIFYVDLSNSPRLRTLMVERHSWNLGPRKIAAPHIHCLNLRYSDFPCTLVDVSSLTEANVNICISSNEKTYLSAGFLQDKVLNMLQKLQHVDKLTFGGNFLEILSLAELRRVPFPKLNVKALTLKTRIFQYVIPGIKRMLQNSHDLKKLTVHTSQCNTIQGEHLDKYLAMHGLNPARCWKPKDQAVRWDVESKHLVPFVELVLKNTKALEKMLLVLDDRYHMFNKMISTLSHNDKVSIVFSD